MAPNYEGFARVRTPEWKARRRRAEEQTPSKLQALQRIANNEFNQELAREKLDLEKRRQALREKQASESAAARAATAAAKAASEGKKDLTTDSTDGHGCGE